MRRLATIVLMTTALLGSAAAPLAASNSYPDVIPLPDGFFPEGIAVGHGHDVYAGSLAGGAIWAGDLRTGEGSILVPGAEGRLAVGMDFDERSGHLFVAGGPGGTLSVYDTTDGSTVAELPLGIAGFVNDVIVTNSAAYVTDSFIPQMFAVALDNRGVPTGDVQALPLTGDFQAVPGFNANGIEATRDGSTLMLVNSSTGQLFTVDPATGEATLIDLGGAVVNGDGLVLAGRTLYAVVGGANQIVEISLAADLGSGVVTDVLTSPDYDVPTTAARFGNSLYAVNAKFNTTPGPDVPYEVIRVDR
jgi:outer membrane protein assembly factor BamB